MTERRIAIVTPTYPPYRGGMGRVAEMDARQLVALGFEVHVYVPSVRSGSAPENIHDGVHVHPLRPWYRWGQAALVPTIGRLLRQYPLVIQHYPFYGTAEFAALARRLHPGGGHLALVYHMDNFADGWLGAIFAAHSKVVMPWIIRSADRVIATTFDYLGTSRLARLFMARSERFRELPPSVDVRRFAPGAKPADLLEKHGLRADEPLILFVGGMDPAHYFKGVPNLLKALALPALGSAKALFVGGGGLQTGFELLARELGVANRVVFAGPASEADLPRYYRLGDVLAFPSTDRSEAFGIVALEALATGLPVVASDLPGIRTIVRRGDTGLLVPTGSVTALAARLADLLDDPIERQRLGHNARRMAIEEYSDEVRSRHLGRIVSELMH